MNDIVETVRNLHKSASYLRNESLKYLQSQTDPLAKKLTDMANEMEKAELEPLVQHAKRELKYIKLDRSETEGVLNAVRAFTTGLDEDSGMSVNFKIMMLVQLLRFQNLTELTDNPEEWNKVGPNVWQSARCAEAFSDDGGKTYYLLSEAEANPSKEIEFHEAVKSDG